MFGGGLLGIGIHQRRALLLLLGGFLVVCSVLLYRHVWAGEVIIEAELARDARHAKSGVAGGVADTGEPTGPARTEQLPASLEQPAGHEGVVSPGGLTGHGGLAGHDGVAGIGAPDGQPFTAISLTGHDGVASRGGLVGPEHPGGGGGGAYGVDGAGSEEGDLGTQRAPGVETITVHVCGAVKSPGVYELQRGKRVNDALQRAGGPTSEACLEAINLAGVLVDAQQVYIPRREEVDASGRGKLYSPSRGKPSEGVILPGHSGERGSPGATLKSVNLKDVNLESANPRKVNLNTCSREQLEAIPGIGPALASRILEYRRLNGGFKAVEELLEVPGIGPKRMEQVRGFVGL